MTDENAWKRGPPRNKPRTLIARRIERRRLECGLSRRELAEVCKHPFPSWNQRLLHGEILAKHLLPLARVLHCPVDWLLTGKVPKPV